MMDRFPVALAVALMLSLASAVTATVPVKQWHAAKCDKYRVRFNKCLTKNLVTTAARNKYGTPNSATRQTSCKKKFKAFVKHCLNFDLTQCTVACLANATATCQDAAQKLCNALTLPSGTRLLSEEDVERELVDGTCTTSPAFQAAIANGVPLIWVNVYTLGRFQTSLVEIANQVCPTPGTDCSGIVCGTASTSVNPNPGQLPPPGPQPNPNPNQYPGLAGLLCSPTVPCGSNQQCCDNYGFCRPGTLQNYCGFGGSCAACSATAGLVCQGANGCVVRTNTPTKIPTQIPTQNPTRVPTPQPQAPSPSPPCFPTLTTVVVRDKGVTTIKDLEVGDHILSVAPTGMFEYSKVVLHSIHEDKAVRAGDLFIRITYEHERFNRTVEATADHFVGVSHNGRGTWADVTMEMAQDVVVGDFVYIATPDLLDTIAMTNHTMAIETPRQGVMAKVVVVEEWTYDHRQSVGNPITLHGNLVVDGMAASTYPVWLLRNLINSRLKPYLYPINFFLGNQIVNLLDTYLGDQCLPALDNLFREGGYYHDIEPWKAYLKLWSLLGRMMLFGCEGQAMPPTTPPLSMPPYTLNSKGEL